MIFDVLLGSSVEKLTAGRPLFGNQGSRKCGSPPLLSGSVYWPSGLLMGERRGVWELGVAEALGNY